ncbi:MAG: hypothetical protein RM368_04320 [Nostoc sp. DedSLP03]|uniref:hypothetical protein n=1 Tax=Nostoc sp. DedSLP03 TaxID=3075400 RepID=UPI002AD2B9E8|nr:hypothetical protein [Nostoc sp. DedSLP03]MDZ7964186.1 hypothetical protein [Nostoc sp. DedSLP03]
MLINQSCLESFSLIEEFDEQAAETIGGGYRVFEIKNKTVYDIPYAIDGTLTGTLAPDSDRIWTAYSGDGLTIEFDADVRIDYIKLKKYNLTDGVYEFQNDLSTDNPYDIDLYSVEPIPLF